MGRSGLGPASPEDQMNYLKDQNRLIEDEMTQLRRDGCAEYDYRMRGLRRRSERIKDKIGPLAQRVRRDKKVGKGRRLEMWKKNKRCEYCNKKLEFDESTIDHRTPRSRGGSNKKSNLALTCEPCNHRKADMTEEEYRNMLEETMRQARAAAGGKRVILCCEPGCQTVAVWDVEYELGGETATESTCTEHVGSYCSLGSETKVRPI